jgi:hypothetical protein
MPAFRPLPALRCLWLLVIVRTMIDVLAEMADRPAEARAVILGLLFIWLEGDSELWNRFPTDDS